MKRSEMIVAIADVLYHKNPWYVIGNIRGERLLREHSQAVLERIEKLGMLPPEIDRVIEGHQCTVNEWETENEKK